MRGWGVSGGKGGGVSGVEGIGMGSEVIKVEESEWE